jgi:hypothetical protein
LALTLDTIIFFNSEFEVIDHIPILDVENLLQDYFEQNLCLISTPKKKYCMNFENSFMKLMFFDYFSSAYYSLSGLTPSISVNLFF